MYAYGSCPCLLHVLDCNLHACIACRSQTLNNLHGAGDSEVRQLQLGSVPHLSEVPSMSMLGMGTQLPQSIGQCVQLQALHLSRCKALTERPQSIGQCVQMQSLSMRWCEALTELPQSIGQCVQLQTFYLFWCKALTELPQSIGQCVQLQTLDLRGCEALTELPQSIGQCVQLQTLDLSGCEALTELPQSIGQCEQLQTLRLYGCKALVQLPDDVTHLTNLRCLDMSGCRRMQPPSMLVKANIPTCCVQCAGSAFAKDYGMRVPRKYDKHGSLKPNLSAFQRALRHGMAIQSLLRDRDARQQTFGSVAVVAVLLATAAFVAFASAPSIPQPLRTHRARHVLRRGLRRQALRLNPTCARSRSGSAPSLLLTRLRLSCLWGW
jgi:hypothetical protein